MPDSSSLNGFSWPKQKLFGKDCRSLQVHSRLQCVEIISLRIDFLGGKPLRRGLETADATVDSPSSH